jgi:hypothetical protein
MKIYIHHPLTSNERWGGGGGYMSFFKFCIKGMQYCEYISKIKILPFCIAVFPHQKFRQIFQNGLWMQGYKLIPANLKYKTILLKWFI